MPRDPYHDFEQDITNTLHRAEAIAARVQFDKAARDELASVLLNVRQDMADVRQTIQIVEESDASRFGIDSTELERRKQFVRKSEAAIQRLAGAANATAPTTTSVSLAWEKEQQQALLAQQDNALETIGTSLHTLRAQAELMGQEADEHVIMLGDLESDVDRTQSRLRSAMSKMDRFVARTDSRLGGWFMWILIAVLMVLVLMVLLM